MSISQEHWNSLSANQKADKLKEWRDDELKMRELIEDPDNHLEDAKRYREADNMAEGGWTDPELVAKKQSAQKEREKATVQQTEWEIARKPFYMMSFLTVFFAVLAILLFNYGILTVFPFMVGAATVFFGLTLVVVIDALLIPGNTYKTISGSSTGLSVVLLAVSILIGIGLSIGQSYVSNPYSAEERVEVQAPQEAADGTGTEDPATDTIPPPADAELALPSSEGRAFREQ